MAPSQDGTVARVVECIDQLIFRCSSRDKSNFALFFCSVTLVDIAFICHVFPRAISVLKVTKTQELDAHQCASTPCIDIGGVTDRSQVKSRIEHE